MLRRFAFLFALPVLLVPVAAGAASLEAEYSVSLRGLPIGRAALAASLSEGRYEATFSGAVRGLMRIFSDGAATASASGDVAGGSLRPGEYTHLWTEDDEADRVTMRFEGGSAGEISAEPPRRRPERYLPVTDAHKADVLDPVSTLIWPAAEELSGGVCDRNVPVFDGRNRFDLELRFDRLETFTAQDGSYAGPALVCAIRYRPISGHRPDRDSIRFMAANEDMEIWMAPAGEAGFLAPVTIRVRTKAGRVVLEARRFEAN